MNIVLWVLQGLLAALFGVGGAAKIFIFERVAHGVASNEALSRGAWTGLGFFEVLCALALVIPGATGTASVLTPIAAACLALEALAVGILHYSYAEYSPFIFNLLLGAIAAFVSYGRLAIRPL